MTNDLSADGHTLSHKEYDRMWRVIDMSLSAHSLLRDQYRRRARVLQLLTIGMSILGTALAFLFDQKTLQVLSIKQPTKVWLGTLSALIFFTSVVSLVVDWAERARAHEDAVRRLSPMKAHFRAVTYVGDDIVASGPRDLAVEYEQTMAAITEIPERHFLRAKSKHKRKVALSKLLDEHAGAPLLYCRLLTLLQGLRKATGDSGSSPASTEDTRSS